MELGAGLDTFTTWGTVPGPAVVEALYLSAPFDVSFTRRMIPMAYPSHIGTISATNLDGLVGGGISLLRGVNGAASEAGVRAVLGFLPAGRFWPRVVVPWASWAPGLLVKNPVVAPGSVYIVAFSVRFLEGVGG